MTAEDERTRLIGDIARVLRDGAVPEEARAAALTLIGWLARRMPGEPVSACDLTRCRGYGRIGAEAAALDDVAAERAYLDADDCGAAPPSGRRAARVPRSAR